MKKYIFFAAIFLVFMYIGWTGYNIWSFSEKNQLQKTEAAIVLGASVQDGEPSVVFKKRIDHALQLYENDNVIKLIFTGGKGENLNEAESEVARKYALEYGVKEEDIFIETESSITEENIQYAKDIMQQNNIDNATIISDPLHMKRAMMIAEDQGLNVYSSPAADTAYQSLSTKIPFFLRELFYYSGYQLLSPFRS
ncbi:YdcF family protein [Alteribacillus sp. YIM 98480]|uniref:YdcF family protein n=1 Tax=Alteribacillus sp. YIM 98480 TaxID=2606599 RepID=UPI00131C8B26|nr:YdcF family protein [Alteribacillus sp. YIM 98480]